MLLLTVTVALAGAYIADISVNAAIANGIVNEKFPWMAVIYSKTPHGDFEFKCGGSLIHKKAILTASHCLDSIDPQDLLVVVNGRETLSLNEASDKEKRNVEKIIRHPRYVVGTFANDAALLILNQEFKMGKQQGIQILKLRKKATNLRLSRCFVAGWGITTDGQESKSMKKLEIPFVEHDECQSLLRRTQLGPYFILDDSFLCAGGEAGKDACLGDGGSPLMCRSIANQQYIQAGIVSCGVGCGDENVPGLYVDVHKVSEWIANEIENNT